MISTIQSYEPAAQRAPGRGGLGRRQPAGGAGGRGVLPFDWTKDPIERLVEAFALMPVVVWLTRGRRDVPDLADRATAARETAGLLVYGAAGLVGGLLLARAFGWHPFGLHPLRDPRARRGPVWAAYNLVAHAVLPLAWFRRGDMKVILVVLVLESLVQMAALEPELFDLSGHQLVVGAPLAFILYLAGPRFLRLTGSTATTVILGGLTYGALHVWDAWTDFGSPSRALLSMAFLLFTYFGPGMIKTVLTVRTGNAWVHVWAYHAVAPHTLNDTPLIVNIFGLR